MTEQPEKTPPWMRDGKLNMDVLEAASRYLVGPNLPKKGRIERGIQAHDHSLVQAALQRMEQAYDFDDGRFTWQYDEETGGRLRGDRRRYARSATICEGCGRDNCWIGSMLYEPTPSPSRPAVSARIYKARSNSTIELQVTRKGVTAYRWVHSTPGTAKRTTMPWIQVSVIE